MAERPVPGVEAQVPGAVLTLGGRDTARTTTDPAGLGDPVASRGAICHDRLHRDRLVGRVSHPRHAVALSDVHAHFAAVRRSEARELFYRWLEELTEIVATVVRE